MTLFADDCVHVMYFSGNNWDTIQAKIRSDFDTVVEWTFRNNLRLKALLHYALIHLRFYFSRVFLAFSLAFLIPTCWYPKRERKREKNARKTREK